MMTSLVSLDLNPPARTLRQFGWIAFFVFGAIGLASGSSSWSFGASGMQGAVRWAFLGIALASAIFSVVAPRANRLLFVGLSVVTYPIGLVVSFVLLATLFFCIIVPIGLLMKAAGRDALRRSRAPSPTYWVKARPPRQLAEYFKQF